MAQAQDMAFASGSPASQSLAEFTRNIAFELAAGGLLALALARRPRSDPSQVTPQDRRTQLLACCLAGVGAVGLVTLMLTITGSENYPDWSAVAVTARRGTSGKTSARRPSIRYSGLKSWPH